MPVRSKRSEGFEGPASGCDESGPLIHASDGSLALAVGKKRRRMSSGVPSSAFKTFPFVLGIDLGGWVGVGMRRPRNSPIDIVGPSSSEGGGKARGFIFGDGGADS